MTCFSQQRRCPSAALGPWCRLRGRPGSVSLIIWTRNTPSSNSLERFRTGSFYGRYPTSRPEPRAHYKSVVEKTNEYESLEELLASIKENVIRPAEATVKELRQLH